MQQSHCLLLMVKYLPLEGHIVSQANPSRSLGVEKNSIGNEPHLLYQTNELLIARLSDESAYVRIPRDH